MNGLLYPILNYASSGVCATVVLAALVYTFYVFWVEESTLDRLFYRRLTMVHVLLAPIALGGLLLPVPSTPFFTLRSLAIRTLLVLAVLGLMRITVDHRCRAQQLNRIQERIASLLGNEDAPSHLDGEYPSRKSLPKGEQWKP